MTKPLSKFRKDKNKYGQYFTPKIIVDFMISLANIDKNSSILEPSCGEGIFIDELIKNGYKNITAYEIDNNLYKNFNFIKNESFVSSDIKDKFDLIIGNPPYIRWKNLEEELKKELLNSNLWNDYFNSLCDYSFIFTLKSIELLKEDGQLIFITPEYWLNTTHSLTLRNYMLKNGYFEKIYHFNETPIFDNVRVSTIIFKYIKSNKKDKPKVNITKYYSNSKLTNDILINLKNKESNINSESFKINQFKTNERWILANNKIKNELNIFEKYCKSHTIRNICHIGNGLVSGLDKAFQLKDNIKLNNYEEKNNIKVIKAKDLKAYKYNNITKYIYINNIKDENELKKNFPNFYSKLSEFKEKLENRYQYNRKIYYWEWVFLRNLNLFSKNEKRIFVPCKERISNKNYFRFALVNKGIYPTQDVTALFKKDGIKESIYYILAILNNYRVFDWLKYNGILKGNIIEFSEKPISSIPFRAIDWSNKYEVSIHNDIVTLTKEYILDNSKENLSKINNKVEELFL